MTASKKNTFTKKFSKKLKDKLNKELSGKVFNGEGKEHDLLREIDDEMRGPVDFFATTTDGKRTVIIELEIHREDPSNNVAKISFWCSKKRIENEVVFIQFFSPHYRRANKKQTERGLAKQELALFLAKKLTNKIKYRFLTVEMEKGDFEKIYNHVERNKEDFDKLVDLVSGSMVNILRQRKIKPKFKKINIPFERENNNTEN